ncbi:MAG TPA: FGGY family carbohydrate kinase [Gemmataceae bacterium]|jgi:sugar (pentulose or hexulose) kinase|nr:FGGY family carbohydrate kinase [Gemmataceae bacterium]
MPLILGIDLGTTKITALAVDTGNGDVAACCTLPNQAETTAADDKSRGYSEWDARRIVETACTCLRGVAEKLGIRGAEAAGLGITGQQHGVILVDEHLDALTPFINWQDRRTNQLVPGTSQTYVERAVALAGNAAPSRAGCRLAAGYLGATLFWMKETGVLPKKGTACFLTDTFGAILSGASPVTDATCGASSGLFDVASGDWDTELLGKLSLPRGLLPDVRPSGALLGGLTASMASTTGLRQGLPVYVGIGDHQASFLGSVGNPASAVFVNVGTGAQVAAYTDRYVWVPLLETRPFPRGGYLLVSAGLCGGASYAVLERFFHLVANQLIEADVKEPLFPLMNRLAAEIPAGAGGLRCEPFFAGTRAQPELRACWSGMSVENFTPAHMARALLEGMAKSFHGGYELIVSQTGQVCRRLVGAGNGLRENAVLARLVGETFGLLISFSRHREEAAYGAALLASVGAGVFPDVATAGSMIDYES